LLTDCHRHTLLGIKDSRRTFMSDSLERLNEVFQEVFDDDELAVSPSTTAEDVEGWDSLMHVTLMIRVEKAFGIKFTSAQVAGLKNVGQLVELIDQKRGV
jgi:acyl carrier protein